MNRFIALIRGINVGRTRKVPMARLRELCTTAGLQKVTTYIQSGNVVFESDSNEKQLAHLLQELIAKEFGFTVHVLILTPKTIREVLAANPFAKSEEERVYFTVLDSAPTKEAIAKLKTFQTSQDQVEVRGHVAYLVVRNGYGKTVLNNNFIEKVLKVPATTRNPRTMKALLELSTG